MNAIAATALDPATNPALARARIALLGTGTVGSAVLARLAGWNGTPLGDRLALVHVANSRVAFGPYRASHGWRDPLSNPSAVRIREAIVQSLDSTPHQEQGGLDVATAALGDRGTRIVVDATASDAVAERHAEWLAQGIHVVTACKLGQGSSLVRWRAIQAACDQGGTHYGDSATVGAGLPLLHAIRALQAGGDRIHSLAGILSGSLAWLFNHYDGLRPFSGFVRQARAAGYTEPDPRDDLSGADVLRKLLILARAAGVQLDVADVDVHSLVPPGLAALSKNEVDAGLALLDAPLRRRYAEAWKDGGKLRFVARLENVRAGRPVARIGIESLADGHALAGGAGTDNRVAIWSDRYRAQPLVIQGPGAGAEVTAAALLDDVLRITQH